MRNKMQQYDEVFMNDVLGGFYSMEDYVNHPPHYKSNTGLESIDVIEAFELDFNLGNAVKYILRCGKKDDACQDLKKAVWYLNRAINNFEEEQENGSR
jgi:hypothetical protein